MLSSLKFLNANIVSLKHKHDGSSAAVHSSQYATVSLCSQSQKPWIESTFTKRECVYILPVSKDPHRYVLRRTVVRLAVIAMETM